MLVSGKVYDSFKVTHMFYFSFFFPFSSYCWRIVGDAGLSYGLECRSSFSHLVGSLDCKSLNMFR